MSSEFKFIEWNARKVFYDAVVVVFLAVWISGFIFLGLREQPEPKLTSVLMGAFGTAALILLNVILAIGPLARINRIFLSLLYNRRHLGVMMFLVAASHAAFGIGEVLDSDGDTPLAVILYGTKPAAEVAFPFELLGLAALVIFTMMAFSSHNFWLAKFTPRIWKWLHMAVYIAYGLIVLHVMLSKFMSENGERDEFTPIALIVCASVIVSLHIIAGWREHRHDTRRAPMSAHGDGVQWIEVGLIDDIPNTRAKIVCPPNGERIAVFREGDKVSAIANVCAHQGGPLGEGQIIDGLVTCPWHGYQFQRHNGCAPAPYTDRVVTYAVRVDGRRIFVNPTPLPAGTTNHPVAMPA